MHAETETEAEADKSDLPSQPGPELEHLVLQMQAEDQLALEALYEATVSRVYRFALAFVHSPADAEEVTEDVYFRAWRDAARFNSERGTVMSWLLTMCRSMALDRLRANGRGERTKQAISAETQANTEIYTDIDLSWAADGSRLHEAIKELSAEQSQVLQLAYFGGYSHSEIAVRLDMKLGTVKTHIRRTVQQLRRQLET